MPLPKGKTNNPNGRPVGSKSQKSLQWEALGESIVNRQAGLFNDYLEKLWSGGDIGQEKAAMLYLQTLEYFKPKQARTEIKQEGVQQLEVVVKRK